MRAAVSFIVYVVAIASANWLTSRYGLVPVGFGLMVTAGTFSAGFALLARDFVHRYGGVLLVLIGIAIGGLISWLTSSPALALASTVAFLCAEIADLLVFTPLRRKGFVLAALASNIVSAPIDTFVFLALAGFPITVGTVAGQLVGKLVWATAVPLILYVGAHRALSRHTVREESA